MKAINAIDLRRLMCFVQFSTNNIQVLLEHYYQHKDAIHSRMLRCVNATVSRCDRDMGNFIMTNIEALYTRD
jgi:hypothetical protein